MPLREDVNDQIRKVTQEIRRLLTARGVPPNHDDDVPSWDVSADQESIGHHYTGTLRVKVGHYRRRTKQFVSNRQGVFKDLKKIADYIATEYQARAKASELGRQQEARVAQLEPLAEALRQEFDVPEYGGDFRITATHRGLVLRLEVIADADQISLLLKRAKEIGMRQPMEDEDEGKDRPNVWDRLNEEAS